MNFYSLPENDQNTITAWINCYAPGDDRPTHTREMPVGKVLDVWANAKSDHLFQLLGNQFIVKRNITMTKDSTDLKTEMEELLDNDDDAIQFKTDFLAATVPFYMRKNLDYLMYHLFSPTNLVDNQVNTIYNSVVLDLPNADDRPILVKRDMKCMKLLGKLAEAFNVPGFEKFRQKHSMVLNQKNIKGTLCLSIHPMDFITMSDNESNWESCMNWRGTGDYRQGTVEMMNSPNVLVAYVESNTVKMPFQYYGERYEWNSKKWRQLFYVDENLMVGVKAYPYQSEDLTAEVRKWIAELANENLHWVYENKEFEYNGCTIKLDENHSAKRLNFKTGYMYSDFGYLPEDKNHIVRMTDKGFRKIADEDYIDMKYSGVSQCMWCGKDYRIPDDGLIESSMCICFDCSGSVRCSCCGERLSEDEGYYLDNGDVYCEYCYDEYIVEDKITNDMIHKDDAFEIYASPFIEGFSRYERDYMFHTLDLNSRYVNWDQYFVHGRDSIKEFKIIYRWGDVEKMYYVNWPDIKPEAWNDLFDIDHEGYYYNRFVTDGVGDTEDDRRQPSVTVLDFV